MRDEIRQVAIEDVAAGARLAEPVCDVKGNVLVPAGVELSESTLASLVRRGFTELMIFIEKAEDAADQAADRERIEARLVHLFRDVADTATGQHLLGLLRKYRGVDHV